MSLRRGSMFAHGGWFHVNCRVLGWSHLALIVQVQHRHMMLLMVCEGAHVFTFASEPRDTWSTLMHAIASLRAQISGATACLEQLVVICKSQESSTSRRRAQGQQQHQRMQYRHSLSTEYGTTRAPTFATSRTLGQSRASSTLASTPPTQYDDLPSEEGGDLDYVDMEAALRGELPDSFDPTSMFNFEDPSRLSRASGFPTAPFAKDASRSQASGLREPVSMPTSRGNGLATPPRQPVRANGVSSPALLQNGSRSRPLSPDPDVGALGCFCATRIIPDRTKYFSRRYLDH